MGILLHIGRYQLSGRGVAPSAERKGVRAGHGGRAEAIGVQSVGIVALLSLFMGAVIAIQTAHQVSGWIPAYTIGFTVRQTTILEFAPTIIPVILSGKVGSNIASQIGTMQVTEQIDALEVMGVWSISHLVLPKLLAAFLIFPFLVVISMVLGIGAGAFICDFRGPGARTPTSSMASRSTSRLSMRPTRPIKTCIFALDHHECERLPRVLHWVVPVKWAA